MTATKLKTWDEIAEALACNEGLRVEIGTAMLLNAQTGKTRNVATMDLYELRYDGGPRVKASKLFKNLMQIDGNDSPTQSDLLRWPADRLEEAGG